LFGVHRKINKPIKDVLKKLEKLKFEVFTWRYGESYWREKHELHLNILKVYVSLREDMLQCHYRDSGYCCVALLRIMWSKYLLWHNAYLLIFK
jgi:hypothetical protein